MPFTKKWIQSALLWLILLLAGFSVEWFSDANIFWPGYVATIIFYTLIYYVAVAGSRKDGDLLLADRQLPLWIAVFTMSATWVGGGFINGTAEYTYSSGLIWVQAPWGYAMSLILGGLFFAKPMRQRGYTTLLDPLEEKFGKRMNLIYYIPALTGDIFWTAAILVALGSTFGTILGIGATVSIILSATVVILYTSIGGLWSVAATDVLQLIILLLGLTLVVAIIYSGDMGLGESWNTYQTSMGDLANIFPSRSALGPYWSVWWDGALLLMLGGIPWQVYFQRVLAAKSTQTAIWLSILSGVVCLLAAIPAVLIGIKALNTDWLGLGLPPLEDPAYTLPHVLRYLTNPIIATVGLGAIAAAVMSSADSSILSAASLTSWNIMGQKKSGVRHSKIRVYIWILGVATMLIALQVDSIYVLWFLCSDLVYCLLFPALVTSLFDRKANHRGALAGFLVALFLRLGGGEPLLDIPAWLPYPMEGDVITIPFRTLAMISGLLMIIIISRLFPDDLSSDPVST